MRIHTLLLLFPIAFVPFTELQKPGAKPPAKAPEKPADTAPVPGSLAIPMQFLTPIEGVVRQLAKGGREKETKDLMAVLEKLGYPKAALDKLEKSNTDDLARAKVIIDSLPAGAKQLRNSAKQLVGIMEKMEDEEAKKALAQQIILLDGDCEAAEKFLGNEKVGSNWVRSEFVPLRKHRGEILQKVEESRALEVELQTGEVDDEYVLHASGVKATMARRGEIELHTNFSAEKTERILREVCRAYALSDWLRGRSGDKLKPPAAATGGKPGATWVLLDSRDQYKKLASDLMSAGKVNDDDAAVMNKPDSNLGGFGVKNGPEIKLTQFEAPTEVDLLVYWTHMQEGTHTALKAGHLNWIALSLFGTTLPNYVIKDGEARAKAGDTHIGNENDKKEREDLLRLAKSGIAGSRAWMQFLVEHGEDPPWHNSFVEKLGELTGNDLHKSTSIVEYLQDSNQFAAVYKRLSGSNTGKMVDLFTVALGMPLGEFESNWRVWIMGGKVGVAERIDKENLNSWPADALAVLEYMNKLRTDTFKGRVEGVPKLKFDPDLSEPCALHAHYLSLHPEQQKWPDAHEEYAGKEGYTVEGAWAGLHSDILFSTDTDYKHAVDVWLGSFYHRLPLLDPGTLRLGWGSEDVNTVLDMGSLVAPFEQPYIILYPFDKATDIPTKFQGNEFPDPVPDKELEKANGARDQVNESEVFGYPITIQTRPVDENGNLVDIDMKLYEGRDAKTEVECFYSTPSKPTNPEAAPSGAWCLIPKTALKGATEYKVVANWTTRLKGDATSVGKHMDWTFRTK